MCHTHVRGRIMMLERWSWNEIWEGGQPWYEWGWNCGRCFCRNHRRINQLCALLPAFDDTKSCESSSCCWLAFVFPFFLPIFPLAARPGRGRVINYVASLIMQIPTGTVTARTLAQKQEQSGLTASSIIDFVKQNAYQLAMYEAKTMPPTFCLKLINFSTETARRTSRTRQTLAEDTGLIGDIHCCYCRWAYLHNFLGSASFWQALYVAYSRLICFGKQTLTALRSSMLISCFACRLAEGYCCCCLSGILVFWISICLRIAFYLQKYGIEALIMKFHGVCRHALNSLIRSHTSHPSLTALTHAPVHPDCGPFPPGKSDLGSAGLH